MKRTAFLLLTVLMLALTLSACGPAKKPDKTPDPESSQSQDAGKEAPQTAQGIINRIDSYLVLLTEDGEYCVMELGEGVTLDGFSEGDSVTVTYTGTLGDENDEPVVTAIEKAE